MTSVTDVVPKAGEFPTLGLSGWSFFLDWKLIAPVCASYSWICSQNSYKRRIGQARSRSLGNLTFLPVQNNLLEMVGQTKAQTWQLADLLPKNEVILRLIVKLIKKWHIGPFSGTEMRMGKMNTNEVILRLIVTLTKIRLIGNEHGKFSFTFCNGHHLQGAQY